jgi:hypothetical protein
MLNSVHLFPLYLHHLYAVGRSFLPILTASTAIVFFGMIPTRYPPAKAMSSNGNS